MRPAAVAVVIPARDEEATIGACLRSVRAAAELIRPVETVIVVVDDSSRDRTRTIARECLQAPSLVRHLDAANVGKARAQGVAWALEALNAVPHDAIWIASTDADTVVPRDWLQRQVTWAEDGMDAVAGLVSLPLVARSHNKAYEAIYGSGIYANSHKHVHGANLGVSASAYQRCGGFHDLRVGEDVALWRCVVEAGMKTVSDPGLVVETSARHQSWTEGGLASYLRVLS